jgi:hypothetical protein
LTNRAGENAAQVLQFMVLDEAISIAAVMAVIPDRRLCVGITVMQHQFAFGHVSNVLAHQRNDTEGLGNQKETGQPRTEAATYRGDRHRVRLTRWQRRKGYKTSDTVAIGKRAVAERRRRRRKEPSVGGAMGEARERQIILKTDKVEGPR